MTAKRGHVKLGDGGARLKGTLEGSPKGDGGGLRDLSRDGDVVEIGLRVAEKMGEEELFWWMGVAALDKLKEDNGEGGVDEAVYGSW